MERKRKNKNNIKQIIAIATGFVMLALLYDVCTAAQDMPLCISYEGDNIEAQDYTRWSYPICSYLSYDGNQTLMKVQAGIEVKGQNIKDVLVEYYDLSYHKKRSLVVPQELPIFGGFHETENNYYLVTGQKNPDESPNVECFRITKYDKNWNRISSVGLYDCNTTVPFDAGSLRMVDDGKYLLIRTCHKMYKSSDGLNHQANVTIQVDMEKMEITDSFTGVMNSRYGYVSHSFNQFIRLENNHIIAADHGDAYPRSLVLIEYATDYTKGSFVPGYYDGCRVIDMLTIPGEIGENLTGASIGGLEISDTSYLLAGNSVIQDENNLSRETRNVFVSAYSKATGEIFMNWITNYAEGDGTTSTPQFVKIAPNQFMLLWSRNGEVYYTQIDGNGRRTGEIYNLKGELSDCVPIIVNNQLVWYVWYYEKVSFYQINLVDLSNNIVNINQIMEHQYKINEDGTRTCVNCGQTFILSFAKMVKLYCSINGDGNYCFLREYNEYNVHDVIAYEIYVTDQTDNNWFSKNKYAFMIEIKDPDIIELDRQNCTMTMKKKGKTTVRIISRQDESVYKEYTIYVGISPEDEIRDFVNRLYLLVLNRDADSTGLNSWTNALVGRTSSGIDIGYGFVFSPECINRNLSNDAFVEMLYQTFMNRGSDAGGKAAWVSQLDAGVEREKIFEGFIYSIEFAEICARYGIDVGNVSDVGALASVLSHYRNQNADITKFVARCYTEALGRDYEPDGLEAWCKVIIEKSNTPKQVAQNFIFSNEFVQKNLSNEEYVEVLYRTFMGRKADEGGLAAWVEVLESGREDRAKVLEGFSDSVEFDGILQLFGLK